MNYLEHDALVENGRMINITEISSYFLEFMLSLYYLAWGSVTFVQKQLAEMFFKALFVFLPSFQSLYFFNFNFIFYNNSF